MRVLMVLMASGALWAADTPARQEFIFPPQALHAHASSIVELPDGRLMACWYFGSGERTADDVKVQAAYLRKGAAAWDAPFTLDDTPGFPDTNPILMMDRRQRLWFIWTAILDNRWETALLKLRISEPGANPAVNPGAAGNPPRWQFSDNILLIPQNFSSKVGPMIKRLAADVPPGRDKNEANLAIERSADKLLNRLGWMPRIHPLELPSGRVLLPLYSDTYNLSLVAITDDGGRSWMASEPLTSLGGVQPSLVRRKDGSVAAYMRDNGPPPQRVLISDSRDEGKTWSEVRDSDIPNPGSSVEVIGLRSGAWCMVLNDSEKGRDKLSVWLSEDEGKTWPSRRTIEDNPLGGFSYPSVIQTKDGQIHATYSHNLKADAAAKQLQTIKHVAFSEAWLKQGR